jgi:hypothetical protein
LTVLDPPANAKIGPLAVFQDHSSPPLRYGDGTSWRRVAATHPARVRGGLDVVLMLAGMLGAIVHQFAGGTAWPGIVAGLLAGGFGVLIWRSHRHRAAHA